MGKKISIAATADPVRAYHHGALRPALIAAAEEVIAERGIDGFSLRETARRAGVSPSAPAHHFGDSRGLLTAIATLAFTGLGDALEVADREDYPDRRSRILAQGVAYVRYALAHQARFDLMWRSPLLDKAAPGFAFASRRAYVVMEQAVLGDDSGGPFGPDHAPAVACWSMVHGFARLAMDDAFPVKSGDSLDDMLDDLLAGMLSHLDV
ncbi:TetR/AcrR family transcriptional regulator [Sphingobium boeckii]|uniref:AcrR family transcriptional regulator n=1 Tax=Sphingobium boeckii TaxID=1082345 RepID=A0A7W9EDQ3_9SPHN|nr:TetR/AcrR family transcriptional regulator [Sphingobium boeckii]MBB5685518.1 AcrR family transcriptional regulator [Sphingobium boeckii]